jgi:hypothetical protein
METHQELIMKIRSAVSYDISNNEPHPLLEARGTLRDEGITMGGTIFIRWTHQFDSTSERWTGLAVKYQDFHNINEDSNRDRLGGSGGAPFRSYLLVVQSRPSPGEARWGDSSAASSKVATSISMPNRTFASAKYPAGSRWFKSEEI